MRGEIIGTSHGKIFVYHLYDSIEIISRKIGDETVR